MSWCCLGNCSIICHVKMFYLRAVIIASALKLSTCVINEAALKSDATLKKLVDGNNGQPAPSGYHSYFVAFVKKPNFKNDPSGPKITKDFSVDGPFFASGVLLSRTWTLTRATPIAYYPIGSCAMVCEKSFPVSFDLKQIRLHDIDFVAVHPNHKPGDAKYDLALARTTKPVDFSLETKSASLGFPGVEKATTQNCKLVVWSWFIHKNLEPKSESVDMGEIAFNINSQDCKTDPDYFFCLSQTELKKQPCGINSGAPLVCDGRVVGIYVGDKGVVACDQPKPLKGYSAVRLDRKDVDLWLSEAIAKPPADDDLSMKLKMCNSTPVHNFNRLLVIIFIQNVFLTSSM